MKRKRIQYNELNEEIYDPKYWTNTRLITIGLILLFTGFLINFSIEEKLNKWFLNTLSSNEACPIIFEKVEVNYFLPKVTIVKPTILGNCFGQPNNRLPFQNIKISIHSPSFYPPGIKIHLSIKEGKTNINIYPVISFFTQFIDVKETTIDSQIFSPMTSSNKSPFAGLIAIDGFVKISAGNFEDGEVSISSKDFHFPAQNINGFEMSLINLNHLKIKAHFTKTNFLKIDLIEVGQKAMPIELKLKGSLTIDPTSFSNSNLQLSGPLHLSSYVLNNFSFIKLFLPSGNATGTYQIRLMGPISNLGPPQFN